MFKAAILAILLALLAWQAASCHHRIEDKRVAVQRQNEAVQAPIASEPPPFPLDPFQRRAAIADSMRLRPDRRFLLAAQEIGRLTADSAVAEPQARFDGSKWILSLGDAQIGTFPELPDYGDLMRPLI